jgi:hypothetical protein
MKHNNKFHFLVLILTAFIFCGQEYIHPFFHQCGDGTAGFIKVSQAGFSTHDKAQSENCCLADSDHSCPICTSFANKSQKTEGVEDKFLFFNAEIFFSEPIKFQHCSLLVVQPRAPPLFKLKTSNTKFQDFY